MMRIHSSCVQVVGRGVLLRGPPGSGKSDLALRLIDGGARLVADDQVELRDQDNCLVASAPANIAGMLEVRGLGLFRMDFVALTTVSVVIDLVPAQEIERLPEIESVEFLGHSLPRLFLNPWELSATAKVRIAIQAATGNIMSVQ